MSLIKTGIAALVLIATTLTAQAQNVSAKVMKGPYYSSPPVHQWTGFYGGGTVGYGLAGLSDNLPVAVTSLMHGLIVGLEKENAVYPVAKETTSPASKTGSK